MLPQVDWAGIIRDAVILYVGRLLCIAILVIFALWLGVAYIVRKPRSRLKSDLTVALWGGLPILVVCGISFTQTGERFNIPYVFEFGALACIFGVVYISLYMPAVAREFFTDPRYAANALSLRLPALIIAVGIGAILQLEMEGDFLPAEMPLVTLLVFPLVLVLVTGWFFGHIPHKLELRFKESKKKGAQGGAEAARGAALHSEHEKANRPAQPPRADGQTPQRGTVPLAWTGPPSEAVSARTTGVTDQETSQSTASTVRGLQEDTLEDLSAAKPSVSATPRARVAEEAPSNSKRSMPTGSPRSSASAENPSTSVIPRVAEGRKMQLKLKRSQRGSLMGKIIYILDARIEIPAEERQLIEKYRLGDLVIYDSTGRKKHGESLEQHLESTKENPSLTDPAGTQLLGVGKTLYRFARAGVSATMASLSLRVTVYSLMKGVHVECKSMIELLGAEEAIVDAGKNLRTYLDTAATFDGREEIIEF
jgi:hypothetical protein